MSRPNKFNNKPFNSSDLIATKPCLHIERKLDEHGRLSEVYGVCTRVYCTFAHSMAELRLPMCGYGANCNRKKGGYDKKTGQFSASMKCQFMHPDETTNQYYERTGKEKPDLPLTSEKTRKPFKKEEEKKADPVQTNPVQTNPVRKYSMTPSEDDDSDDDIEVILERKPEPVTKTESVSSKAPVDLCVPKAVAMAAIEALLAEGITKINIRII
jgi:hypothetical protein